MEEECRAARSEWMAAFDEEATPETWVAGHLAQCPACRRFAASAESAREGLRALPLPAPDRAADLALLTRLRRDPPGWRERWLQHLRELAALEPARVLPLFGAGAAAFAATLAAAGLFAVLPEPGAPQPKPFAAVRHPGQAESVSIYQLQLETLLPDFQPGTTERPANRPKYWRVPRRKETPQPSPRPALPTTPGKARKRGAQGSPGKQALPHVRHQAAAEASPATSNQEGQAFQEG